jgi:opacity protein-like surface antigen
MKALQILSITAGLFGSLLVAHGQGVLGQNYVQVSGGFSSSELSIDGLGSADSDSGYMVNGLVNFALIEGRRSDLGLDLSVGVGYEHIKFKETVFTGVGPVIGKITGKSTNVYFGFVPYIKLSEQFKLYGEAGIGYADSKTTISGSAPWVGVAGSISESADGMLWGLGAGVEFTHDAFSIMAGARYTDGFDSKFSSVWSLRVSANYWLNEQWGLGLGYSHASSSSTGVEITSNTISGSVRFSF